MKKRLVYLLAAGAALLGVAFLGLRYVVWLHRPQTKAEWIAEKQAANQARWLADRRKEIEAGLAVARNPRERKLYEYDLRLVELGERNADASSIVKLRDGVDEFEALLIARAYFDWQFGACGSVGLPEQIGEQWVVAISAGREATPQPSIVIEARTGVIRCAGHPTISDVLALLEGRPNKAPEPTPGAVTPRAIEGKSK